MQREALNVNVSETKEEVRLSGQRSCFDLELQREQLFGKHNNTHTVLSEVHLCPGRAAPTACCGRVSILSAFHFVCPVPNHIYLPAFFMSSL